MANSAGNEHQPSSRTPARLVVSVLVLGTLLAWWGTRDDRRLFGEPPREPTFASPASSPRNAESDAAMVAQGYQIAESECAGCHDENTRSIGPSYREIASFYRRQSTPGNNKPNLLSAIAAAVAHPQPGWANFPPGPSLSSMPLEDRITVASWIVNVGQKKGAGEGPEK